MGICPVGPTMIHLDKLTDMTKLTDMSCEITMATLQNKTNTTEMVGKKALMCIMVLPAFMEKNKVPSPAED